MPLVGGLVRKTPRAVALFGVAAILALSLTIISGPHKEAQAAGSAGSPGSAWAWGDNRAGQLGNGTVTATGCSCIPTPVPVSLPTGTTVTAIAGGTLHSLALTPTGQVLAWGYNFDGELGNGSTTNSSPPVAVSLPSGTLVIAIAGGTLHSLAMTSTGQVFAWGYNFDGELGNGTTTTTGCQCITTPVTVSLPSGPVVTPIAAGGGHGLAL